MIPLTPLILPQQDKQPEATRGPSTVLLDVSEFEQFDRLLDLLRERDDEAPQWEFLEGAMAALVCSRQPVPASDYAPLLLGVERDDIQAFGSASDTALFWRLWERRWAEVSAALAAEVQSLEDGACYHPEVLDMRGALAALAPGEQGKVLGNAANANGVAGDAGAEACVGQNGEDNAEARALANADDAPPEILPSFAQVWALGFMFVVENWADHWQAPRDKELAQWLDQALSVLVDLTEDDRGTPINNLYDEAGPPSVSQARTDAYAQAIWAVYDLHQLWRSLGPKTTPQRAGGAPGRNGPCVCGSGKKYKKCCGA